jgi:hypothetical protein
MEASWPGLTRPSIRFARWFLAEEMDTRVKPAYDAIYNKLHWIAK